MSILKKSIKKTPNIDFVFGLKNAPTCNKFIVFFIRFFKICPFLHPPPRIPRFNISPFPTGTPVLTFLRQKIYNFSLAKKKTFFLISVLEISLFAIFVASKVKK
eukprot:UN27682